MMNLSFQSSVALMLFIIGVFVNILVARRMVRSKKVAYIGFVATFVGIGLFVPFTWWDKVGLSPWSGMLGILIFGTLLSFLIDVWRDAQKAHQKKQRR